MKHLRKFTYILAVVIIVFCSACTNETTLGGDWSPSLSPRQLSLSAYDMNMPVEGGKETVNVTSENASWNFAGSDASWLTLAPKSGNGNVAVTLTAQANLDPTTGRSVAYAFACTDADWQMTPRQFSVSQQACGYFIRPAEKNFTKAASATQFEVGIEANASWTAKSDAGWLSVQPNFKSLTVSLTDNTTSLSADRIGHITLICGNSTEIVTVNQQPPNMTMADEVLIYEQEGGDKSIEIKSDVPWTASCSQSWITLSSPEGKAGTTSLFIHVSSNTSVNERTANVYVNIGGKSLRSIPIRQHGAYVNSSVIYIPAFSYQGGSQTLTITANTDWTVIDHPEFVSISPISGGRGETKVIITTEDNLGEKSLSGDIVFGNASITGLQTKVHVEQECPNIGISEQTITVGSTADSKHQLTLTTNQSWTAAFQSGTWAHVSTSSGDGSATLTLSADDNPSIQEREDVLTITPSVTKTPLTFRFIQRGKTLEVSATTLSIRPKGGTSEPVVITTDGTYSVTQTGNWFTISQNGNNITVSAQENTTYSQRSGSVEISLINLPNGESLYRRISISQNFGHEYVDLGLPSGTLWATCNIGADNPEDYGDYFAWGETQPKSIYNWSTYFDTEDGSHFYKYYGNGGKIELEPKDDAATSNWGSDWCMPTRVQINELISECSWTSTSLNGVNGYVVKSKNNGCSLFLPAAGSREESSFHGVATGYYWTRSLQTSYRLSAYLLQFSSSLGVNRKSLHRYSGYSVRPVRKN